MPSIDTPPDLEVQASPAVHAYPPPDRALGQDAASQVQPQEQADTQNATESQSQHDAAQDHNGPDPGYSSLESRQPGISRATKPRAKRGKYISKACNECKRRKSKCNGQRPCGRCAQHSLECIYALSNPSAKGDANISKPASRLSRANRIVRSTQAIQSLSDQVAQLQGNLERLRNGQPQGHAPTTPSPSLARPPSRQTLPPGGQADENEESIHVHATPPSIASSHVSQSRQPTVNYTFNLELARQHLRSQGTRMGDNEPGDTTRPSDCTRQGTPTALNNWDFTSSSIDPLWLIEKKEALRLCHVYEEEIGISYPFLSLQALIDKANALYDAMEAGSRSGFAFSSLPGPTVIDLDDLDILRLAMSTALVIETSGASDLGNALFAKVQEKSTSKIWQPTSLKSIALYTLMAIHAFLCGDDLQAWRLIGIPARWCLELGLHQAVTYTTKFKSPPEKKMAIRLFWSIHTLDRRWSFGAGLPFVIQSNDIEPDLAMPDEEVPYLRAMVNYNRIGAKVWSTLYGSSTTETTASKDEVDFLHYSIDRWYRDVPAQLKLPQDTSGPTPGRGLHRLQMLLYLRACQTKILLYQSVLHSVSRFKADGSEVRLLVDTAKDMVQKLDHLNKTTDIYETQQVCFNHFLISALGVIFLAVALEPMVYRSVVQNEFNMALDLVRGFSKRSYVSRQLWKMIRGLRQVGVRLGLTNQQADDGVNQPPNAASPANMNTMLTPPLLASPNSLSGPPQTNQAWLNSEITSGQCDFMAPLNGTQMTLALNDLLAAMESENGIWIGYWSK